MLRKVKQFFISKDFAGGFFLGFGLILLGGGLAYLIPFYLSIISTNPEKYFDQSLFFTLWLAEVPIIMFAEIILRRLRKSQEIDYDRLAKAIAVGVVTALEEEKKKQETKG